MDALLDGGGAPAAIRQPQLHSIVGPPPITNLVAPVEGGWEGGARSGGALRGWVACANDRHKSAGSRRQRRPASSQAYAPLPAA